MHALIVVAHHHPRSLTHALAAHIAEGVVRAGHSAETTDLAALYQDYDLRQTALMEAALEASEATLEGRADVIARAYVDCVMQQGREIPGVVAALASSPELERIKRDYEVLFMDKCRAVLEPFAGGGRLTVAALRAMIGAAEALSHAAATEEIAPEEARRELYEAIVAMVARSRR